MKQSAKIISIVVGAAISIGTVGVAAAVNNQFVGHSADSSAITSSTAVSSTAQGKTASAASAVSSALSSAPATPKGTVSTVTDGVNEIQQATNNGVSEVKKAADDGVSAVKQAQSHPNSKVKPDVSYAVINPQTGGFVCGGSNYEKFKAELGGDAGLVPPSKSTACQAALKKIHEKYEADKAASQAAQKAEQAKEHHQLAANQP